MSSTPSGMSSEAHGINLLGQAVGQTGNDATLWQGNQGYNLNTLVARPFYNAHVNVAYGANDLGQIVGGGTFNGQAHAFLFTPDFSPTPSIEFTSIPPYGQWPAWITGNAYNADPQKYDIAVYIYVVDPAGWATGWWTKPYWVWPTVSINVDGTFSCLTTTGGIDEIWTRCRAYLIPKDYSPPLSGGGALPAELEAHALAEVEVVRVP